ncbi:acyl-CoA/acyl-ACP dehydrogenase [Nocardioides sp. Y6]|uniref:Acyl-CoA/acyl-ACP dehydrogenase n=1 Tax=Nocardioides malaquae TaxID=2773426 RepID=A0ABR9RT72_9ACTN|nr:acyl-CoA dehydrogenase family protein [Nocardioides malaquae]MBE7324762.1 acyl-CoA/acyl-ACP dehydrogenase [Nocardioides malaquae]
MDFDISDEQQAMVAGVRDVLRGRFSPSHFRELEDNSEWPWEAMQALGDHGYLSILAPEELGGAGGSSLDAMLCLEEAARVMGGPAMAYFTTMCFGVRTLAELGTPLQQERILPGLMAGTSFVGLSLTEPDGGTDVLGAMRTRAKQDADGSWVINGAKIFTTGAHIADYVIAVVRTDNFEKRGSYGVTMFLVPTDAPGLTITQIPLFAQRTTGANNVVFDDVRVPEEMVLGEVHKGLYSLFNVLNDERIGAATMALGIAQAAFDEALEYAKTRTAFNRPIGQFQAVQHKLAEIWVRLQAVRQTVYRAAWLQSEGKPAEMESSGAKLLASETCIWVVNECMDILGGYSHTLEFNMSYYLRDGRYTFAPVTNNAVKNLIGERLGLPKSY